MRTIITSLLCLLVIGSGVFQSCGDASAAKEASPTPIMEIADPYIVSLRQAGFVNTPLFATAEANSLRKKYKEMYGMGYLSNKELVDLEMANGLYQGPAENYVRDIPQDAVATFTANYNKAIAILNDSKEKWTAPNYAKVTREELKEMNAEDQRYVRGGIGSVVIIAPLDHFNTKGMDIVEREIKFKPKDPIIVMVLDGGVIELARWQ